MCNCCSYLHGERLIGLYVDLLVDQQWDLCRILAFDPLSHSHLLLCVHAMGIRGRDTEQCVHVVVLMDYVHVLRCHQDVFFEVSVMEGNEVQVLQHKARRLEEVEEKCLLEKHQGQSSSVNHSCVVCSPMGGES